MFIDLIKVDLLTISALFVAESNIEFGLKVLVLISTLSYNIYKFKKEKDEKKL
jgi:hypothetical protein